MGVKSIYFIRVVSNINIRLMVPVEDSAIAEAYIRADRHADIQDNLFIVRIFNRCEIKGKISFCYYRLAKGISGILLKTRAGGDWKEAKAGFIRELLRQEFTVNLITRPPDRAVLEKRLQ